MNADEFYLPEGFQTGSRVSGRKIVEANQVLFIPREKFWKCVEFTAKHNQSFKGYVLVSDIDYCTLHKELSFAGYSNAGALVFDENKSGSPLASIQTHFGGALREAGIPVLTGELEYYFRQSLKPGLNEINVLLYANDEKQEGFMAAL